MSVSSLTGVGLGLRAEFVDEFLVPGKKNLDFLELVPENWMQIAGQTAENLQRIASNYPLVAHGLSLSIGSPAALNIPFIQDLAQFFKQYPVEYYSDHLSYCSDEQGYIHELLPIPFTEEAVFYLSARIRQVQDMLGRRLVLENASYYYPPDQVLAEIDFIKAVLEESDCLLLLDVNNVYVNSFNHGYDPYQFIQQIPSKRIAYMHIAGHWQKRPDLIIDTHGSPVVEPVWELLEHSYACHGLKPTLLERDTDIPALSLLLEETQKIRQYQSLKELA